MSKVNEPFPIFYDDDGTPLENGMIYVGAVGQDARQNPIQLYWDEARTQPAAQPIRTLGGRPSYQGAPASIFTAAASYSVAVFNKFGTPVTANDNTSPSVTAQEIADIAAASAVNTYTGTSQTLALVDQNAIVRFTNNSAITLTLPNTATVPFAVGSFIEVHQVGTGQITFVAGSGATLQVRTGFSKTAGQYSVAGLRVVAANTFVLTGDLA